MTRRKSGEGFDFGALRLGIERCDPDLLFGFYADDARLKVDAVAMDASADGEDMVGRPRTTVLRTPDKKPKRRNTDDVASSSVAKRHPHPCALPGAAIPPLTDTYEDLPRKE